MVATGTAAVSRLVLYRREHVGRWCPRARDRALDPALRRRGAAVGRLLPEGAEGRGEADAARGQADPLAPRGWSERFLEDTVQEQMKKIVAGKSRAAGEGGGAEAAAPTPRNVGLDLGCAEGVSRRTSARAKASPELKPAVPVGSGLLTSEAIPNGISALPVGSGASGRRNPAQGRGIGDPAGAFAAVSVPGRSRMAKFLPSERHRHRSAGPGAGPVGDDQRCCGRCAGSQAGCDQGARLVDRREVRSGSPPAMERAIAAEALYLVPAGSVGRLSGATTCRPLPPRS